MNRNRKVKVLVVDDSRLSREIISRGISRDENIVVVGQASDPFEARDRIEELNPDVITLDINMPKMNGIEFLRKLMSQHPIPTVVISGMKEKLMESLEAGAVDFVSKPDVKTKKDLEGFLKELEYKVKTASTAKLVKLKNEDSKSRDVEAEPKRDLNKRIKVIAVGASTGGTEAFFKLIKQLPTNIPGMVVVQHMPSSFTKMYADRLNSQTGFEVIEAKSGDEVKPGRIIIAPGDFHMQVRPENGKLTVRCYEGEKVSGHCPSVDVLFESVAEHVGKKALGVILTGMGRDGAKGLLSMKQRGAYTIGQDRDTSVVYGMPMVSYNIGAVEKQVPIDKMGKAIVEYL
ncbi:chemotaxis response regulator protein-glutamate methylesterase [Andreesenia angusta]|uniref:Protein-glutamate methylesterase/protein-glutamine glutaminase n=1 Tax=Andreesenia angusta TaxID=39480 RepID=A0A1S1VAL7_9FIRM|nr:chemotaxis response regulator protein-glutamate methylesterase [Andreesenia angusta]OHW63247.1 chemotaxis response regulator protein-glutamate methylesterase [Andreesenia angusta]